jgi:hypothetical protein
MTTRQELEAFIDESITQSVEKRHRPSRFIEMRDRDGTMNAIVKLVETSDEQSGFVKAKELGLIDWCLETAVVKFQDQFSRRTLAYALARLDGRLFARKAS